MDMVDTDLRKVLLASICQAVDQKHGPWAEVQLMVDGSGDILTGKSELDARTSVFSFDSLEELLEHLGFSS